MGLKTIVGGVGMIPFLKPEHSERYDRMAAQAISVAPDDARLAPLHNIGIGGACVVTLYRKA